MAEREVTAEEVMSVLHAPATVAQGDASQLVHSWARIRGRYLRVTINAVTDVVVTVVTEPLKASGSLFGWFTLGASLEVRS
jgi:hypothetical protein